MKEGYEVKVLDNLSSGSLENVRQWLSNSKFKFIKGDLKRADIAKKCG